MRLGTSEPVATKADMVGRIGVGLALTGTVVVIVLALSGFSLWQVGSSALVLL